MRAGGGLLGLLLLGSPGGLAGCAPPPPPTPPAPRVRPAPPPPVPQPSEPIDDILRQTVLVEPHRPVVLSCQLLADRSYVLYAAALDETSGVQPTLEIVDEQGRPVALGGQFRNDLFCAAFLRPTAPLIVQLRLGCRTIGGGVAARVQRPGRLAPGQSQEAVLADWQTFHFYELTLAAGDRIEAGTTGLAAGVDTLLTLHRLPDLAILVENDDIADNDMSSEILWHCRQANTYLLAVTAWTRAGVGQYRLAVERLIPARKG